MNMSIDKSSNQAYVFDDEMSQFTRLRNFASVFHHDVAQACQHAHLGPGSSIVDVGCGPLGALLDLSEIVGQSGRVAGIDQSTRAIQTATDLLKHAGRTNVALHVGDINVVDPDEVCGGHRFDAAYCRLVMAHQKEPEIALANVARLVRPGGCVILHECQIDPSYPKFRPDVPATVQFGQWLLAVDNAIHASFDVPWRFSQICAAAGLQEVHQRGFMHVGPAYADRYLEFIYETVRTLRGLLPALNLATTDAVDTVLRELASARENTYQSFIGVNWIEMLARVP